MYVFIAILYIKIFINHLLTSKRLKITVVAQVNKVMMIKIQ